MYERTGLVRSDAPRRLHSDVCHAGAEEQAFQATGHVALMDQLVAAVASLARPDGEAQLLLQNRALAVVGRGVRELRLQRVQQLRPPHRVRMSLPADVRPRTGARAATHAGRAVGGPPRPAIGACSSFGGRCASAASTLLCSHSSGCEKRGQYNSDANEVK